MILPDELVAILACPRSKAPLIYFPRGEDDTDLERGFLVCPASRLRYRIQEGVPVMLVDEATEVPPAEIARLISRAKQLGLPVPT